MSELMMILERENNIKIGLGFLLLMFVVRFVLLFCGSAASALGLTVDFEWNVMD